ncbi:hypothetical protein [Polyangium spumosum]|uniref:MipA/OmpV family protein n=1 Tax=Polyangium spumosum TaxID=889282 RepID=A0A6N7PK72_9BACT|nr:hypothetical protein [Polyangium spumosum]MRG92207.1 hypothetical protein [Polyangium spumosum]
MPSRGKHRVAVALATAAAVAAASASAAAADPASPVGGTLRFGVEVAGRSFAYSDPLKVATNLRPYDVAGVPLLRLGGELRPLQWTRVSVLEDVGITGEYTFAPYLSSSVTAGADIRTSWDRGSVGLRVPIRLGRGEHAAVVAPVVGYGWLDFSFQETGPLAAEIPTVGYRMLRVGVDGRLRLKGPVTLLGAFEYLEPVSGGALYERFRDATIGGIDTSLGLALAVTKGAEVSLSVAYTRFFSTFVPVPGDAYVAGGALDQFVSVKLGIDYAP